MGKVKESGMTGNDDMGWRFNNRTAPLEQLLDGCVSTMYDARNAIKKVIDSGKFSGKSEFLWHALQSLDYEIRTVQEMTDGSTNQ